LTDVQFASMSTALWIVATVALFILLAEWSNGGSWGLSASIVRGVRGWSDLDGEAARTTSPSDQALRPILDPYADLRRGQGHEPRPMLASAAPAAEVIELGERSLPR
jgi:hypothetical protein